MFVGLGSDTRGGHHSSTFDFDEDLLLWGVDILWGLVENRRGLAESLYRDRPRSRHHLASTT